MKQTGLMLLAFIFSIFPEVIIEELRKLHAINKAIYFWGLFSIFYFLLLLASLGNKADDFIMKIIRYLQNM